jgi:hypothetical protein
MKYLALAAVVAALSARGPAHAMATEIAPTPKMLAEVRELNKYKHPREEDAQSYEYHFRNLGRHVLYCAYYSGGNGGFCKKITPQWVASIDRAAAEYCKGPDADGPPPHAVYGELYDLDYKCARGHMSRLPVGRALDEEGYVRSQWEPLP